MGPIEGIGVGGTFATDNTAARSTQSAQAGGTNQLGGQTGIRSGSLGSTAGLNKVMSALSDFLRTMDTTSQSDKTLQMLIALLIALMILMAIISGQSGNAPSSGASLDGLSGGSGQGQLFAQSTSTTISIEQSTTTFALGAGNGYSGSDTDAGNRGASMDLRA